MQVWPRCFFIKESDVEAEILRNAAAFRRYRDILLPPVPVPRSSSSCRPHPSTDQSARRASQEEEEAEEEAEEAAGGGGPPPPSLSPSSPLPTFLKRYFAHVPLEAIASASSPSNHCVTPPPLVTSQTSAKHGIQIDKGRTENGDDDPVRCAKGAISATTSPRPPPPSTPSRSDHMREDTDTDLVALLRELSRTDTPDMRDADDTAIVESQHQFDYNQPVGNIGSIDEGTNHQGYGSMLAPGDRRLKELSKSRHLRVSAAKGTERQGNVEPKRRPSLVHSARTDIWDWHITPQARTYRQKRMRFMT